MPEVIFTGPAGRLEGRYHPAKQKNAPIAMVLHPHPQFHGTMNHQIIYQCYYAFAHRPTTPDQPFIPASFCLRKRQTEPAPSRLILPRTINA